MDFDNYNNELIDLWTSKFLSEFERPRTCTPCRKDSKRKLQIVFGRTTYVDNVDTDRSQARRRTVMTASPAVGRTTTTRTSSIFTPTKLSESRAHLTQQRQRRSLFLDGQDSKMQGVQMLNFNIDRRKAEEKRKRMKQYARELRLGARSQLSREIDSITRLVVKSFKSVILAERCALFLHDESTQELYFKPVGDNESHARLKEIRFPAKQGVAGWCATNKACLNIHNAYKDHRFNSDIDKRTGFRTRTILCHPVLADDNSLLGVIQMVNKKKGNERELRDMAKKKKTSNSHKGYNSCFEPFSERDEEILAKCCNEVSKSLQAIFAQYEKKTERNLQLANQEVVVEVETSDGIMSAADLPSSSKRRNDQEDGSDENESFEQTTQTETQTEDDSTNYRPEPPNRRSSTNSTRRRSSSVGTLAQFLKRNSLDSGKVNHNQIEAFDSKGILEAIMKFQFRSPDGDTRRIHSRQSDSEYLQAVSKRSRMKDYHKLNSQRI